MGPNELVALSIAVSFSFINFALAICAIMAYKKLNAEVERLKNEVIEERFRRRMGE